MRFKTTDFLKDPLFDGPLGIYNPDTQVETATVEVLTTFVVTMRTPAGMHPDQLREHLQPLNVADIRMTQEEEITKTTRTF